MASFVLIVCALASGAPTSETADEVARRIADGRGDMAANIRSLLRKGRFGLSALVELGRSTEGEGSGRVYEAVGAFRGPEAFSALLEGLRASDRHAQLGAVRGLARASSKDAVKPLVETAVTTDPEVRKAVVDALVQLGKAAEGPVKKLVKSPSRLGRESALRFFARFYDGEKRRETILQGLRDRDENVREAAIELAELWRDMSLAESLVTLSRDPSSAVAARAVEAVAKFPSLRRELPELLSDPRVTEQAWMTAFHRMRDYDNMAVPYLLAAIAKADRKRQSIMFDLLAKDASEGELRALVDQLDSDEEDVTDVVTGLLGQMGGRADTAAARMVLTERESLAEAIRQYLSSRPNSGITDEILTSAREGTPDERAMHIAIIGELDPGQVRDDLTVLLDDTETEIRVAAARALAGLRDDNAEAELVRLLDDPKPEVRQEAIRGLRPYTSRLSVLARMSAIEDPHPDVRVAAMRSFEGSQADKSLEALARVVRSGPADERVTALTTISTITTDQAAHLLVDLVTDSTEGVKAAATEFFGTLPALEPRFENAGQ